MESTKASEDWFSRGDLDSAVKVFPRLEIKPFPSNRLLAQAGFVQLMQPEKKETTMEKNIAALLRQDVRTVEVAFGYDIQSASVKAFTYVTNLVLAVGDKVVVDAKGRLVVGTVVQVHTELSIRPKEEIEYKWVAAKVDLTAYEATQARNKEIEDAVDEAYRSGLQRTFKNQVLGELAPEVRLKIEGLL